MCRAGSPLLLAEKLEDLVLALRSDRTLAEWMEINEIADRISCNEDIIYDGKYIDKDTFLSIKI